MPVGLEGTSHLSPFHLRNWETAGPWGRESGCGETCPSHYTKAAGRKSRRSRETSHLRVTNQLEAPFQGPLWPSQAGWELWMENPGLGDWCSGFIPTCGLFYSLDPVTPPLWASSFPVLPHQGPPRTLLPDRWSIRGAFPSEIP